MDGGAAAEHPEDSRPHIDFGLLWTDEWWQHLVTETNRYAEAQGANENWSAVNVVEMRAFKGRCVAFNFFLMEFHCIKWINI